MEGFYEDIGNLVSDGWYLLSNSFRNDIDNLSDELEIEIASTVQSLINQNNGTPDFSNSLPSWVEFNETIEIQNASLLYYGMNYNNNYGTWRLTEPGYSYLETSFQLDELPNKVFMSILHLTSYSEAATNNGYSPIDIYINGNRIEDNFDVAQSHGDHSWHTDNWSIDPYLVTGQNRIRIELEDDPWATTHYWIRNMYIQEGEFIESDTQTLETPTLTVSKGTYSDYILVSWSSVSGATGYDLYRNTTNNSSTATKIASGSSSFLSYEDDNVESRNTYYYWVKAKSNSGGSYVYSEFSNGDYGWLKESNNPTFTDSRDGKEYNYVVIGDQTWMAENLAFIPYVAPANDNGGIWVYDYNGSSTSEAKQSENYQKYGCLYNWETAKDVCPDGWHLPSDEEWKVLERYLGMSEIESNEWSWRNSGEVGKKLKVASSFNISSEYADNSSGFSALAGGNRFEEGFFDNENITVDFWTNGINGLFPVVRYLNRSYKGICRTDRDEYQGNYIRCIKNTSDFTNNHSPSQPTVISPTNNSTVNIGEEFNLSWNCTDVDNNLKTFYLLLREKGENGWEYVELDSQTNLLPAEASESDKGFYEWKIIACDLYTQIESEIWNFTIGEQVGVNSDDSLALVALYNSCDGDNWSNNTNWLKTPVKDWYGVTVENGRVTSLKLNATYPDLFGLKNNLPPEIGQLTNLDYLDLSFNELTGPIPPEIGNLTNLRVMQLTFNKLSGSIPREIGNLNSLTHLILADNELSGTIPPEIGDLQNLQTLMITYNQLSGAIPEEIGDLESIDNIHLYNNSLSGEIPSSIGNLTNLTYLGLSSNNLSGTIPSHLFDLNNLEKLIIAYNDFSGTFPEDISKLTSLVALRIDRNKFSGKLTDKILQLPNLDDIWIEENNFTEIPDFSSKENLIRLKIFNNNLTFEDIEPNMPVVDIVNNSENQYAEFVYSPQKKIGEPTSEQIEEGQEYTLSIDCGGVHNQYQWIKDGIILGEPTSEPEYIINSFSNEDEGVYMCKVTNSIVPDLVLESYTITLSTEDITSPTLSINPSTGSNLPNQFSITLTFSENVTNVAEGISVNNGTVNVEGEGINYIVTINAEDNTSVTLFVANSIIDMAGNHFEGGSYNYSVGDNTPPRIISYSPNNIEIEDNHPTFNFSFDEEINLGNGTLKVYQNGESTPIISIPFVESMIEGNDVTVSYDSNIDGSLELSTEYCVTIDAGSFTDLSGNVFEGILDNDTWCFTTGDNYATGVNEIPKNQLNLLVIPNPNDGKFRLRFENRKAGTYQVQVINELGQVQLQKEIYLSGNVHEEEFKLSHLSSGNYFVKVYDGNVVQTKKVIFK